MGHKPEKRHKKVTGAKLRALRDGACIVTGEMTSKGLRKPSARLEAPVFVTLFSRSGIGDDGHETDEVTIREHPTLEAALKDLRGWIPEATSLIEDGGDEPGFRLYKAQRIPLKVATEKSVKTTLDLA